VHILVNNAGGTFRAPFLEVTPKGQQALVDENFTSVTTFIRAVVPLVPPEGGSIVNITSIEAHRAGPEYAIYSAQKAAVANLTKSLALELGARLIRVNCIAPDLIPTPGEAGMAPPGLREGPPRTPLARHATADDVAAAVVFLSSDASRFVTGSTIHVDGGNWAAGGWRRLSGGGFSTSASPP
jgi:NAD(P)-dependent dehydrogenase (short-subunit alcohol dehydrogenase family)